MRASLMRAFFLAYAFPSVLPLHAQEYPVLTTQDLEFIDRKINRPPAKLAAEMLAGKTVDGDSHCKLLPFELGLTETFEGGAATRNQYQVLADKSDPTALFLRFPWLHVDADGSRRAYHPLDPRAQCKKKETACAIDHLSNAGVLIFAKATKTADPDTLKNEAFEKSLADAWPLIKDAKPTSSHGRRYNFHTAGGKLFVSFRNDIIPQSDKGAPCTQRGGFFVSLSSLSNKSEKDNPDGCRHETPDPEVVPFIVIPRSSFASAGKGTIGLGDLALVHYQFKEKKRFSYAIVGDEGPATAFGEGSIALSKALLQHTDPIENVEDLNNLAISQGEVSVLVLGGSRTQLDGKYDPKLIASKGAAAFKDWLSSEQKNRFYACLAIAANNTPKK